MVKLVGVPRSLSVYSAFIDLPSAETVIRNTPTIFPARLSVSSIGSLPIPFSATMVWPGSRRRMRAARARAHSRRRNVARYRLRSRVVREFVAQGLTVGRDGLGVAGHDLSVLLSDDLDRTGIHHVHRDRVVVRMARDSL